MTVRDKKIIIRNLRRKGFVQSESKHKHFRYYDLTGERTPIFTVISHGIKEYNNVLLKRIGEEIRLRKNQDLLGFIDCHVDQVKYEKILKSQNEL
ncbi:MAG: hypothetical protein K8S87_01555 [Planctomycetes bacterium]|nr:hypothetical protein [Planctomycetota bacterium]